MRSLLFEIKYLFRQPAVYATFIAFFVLSFLMINAADGLFDSVKIMIQGNSKIYLNSPSIISFITIIFSILGLAVTANIFSSSIYRDVKYSNDQIMFCKGINKANYLIPKFIAPLFANTIVFLAVPLGATVASFMPYLDASYFGPFMLKAYIVPLVQIAFPNILFTGAIFFVLTALRKDTSINWMVVIVFYVCYVLSISISHDIDNQFLTAMLDPFGSLATAVVETGSSISDKNTESTSLEGVLLYNRLLWGGLGVIIFLVGYLKFRLSLASSKKTKKKLATTNGAASRSVQFLKQIKVPLVQQQFNFSAQLYQLKSLFLLELKKLIRSTYFKVMVVLLLVVTITALGQVGKIYDTVTYVLTYKVAETLFVASGLLYIVFIILFTGELVWNSRKFKVNHFEDASALRNFHFVLPKLFALAATIFVMLFIQWLCSFAYQTYVGTTHEFGVMGIFILNKYLYYLLFIALAFVINALVGNRFVAYLILGLWYFTKDYLANYLQHNLLVYNNTSTYIYSEINGFGGSLLGEYSFRLYWVLFAIILLYISTHLISRGSETHFKKRFKALQQVSLTKHLKKIGPLLVAFILVGSFIFYNTNILNEFQFSFGRVKKQLTYENKYNYLSELPQPEIIALNTTCHIYPEEGKIDYSGDYYLKNNTNTVIDSLVLNLTKKVELVNENELFTILDKDENFEELHLYKIKQPLQPNDSVKVAFTYLTEKKGFKNIYASEVPFKNGTKFFSPHPKVGYAAGYEISENALRKKHGLQEKPALPSRDDEKATMKNSLGNFVQYKSVISTSAGQKAFTSGKLVNEWQEDNRNFYKYEAEDVIDILAYNSAVFNQKEKTITTVVNSLEVATDLAINYHPKHDYNIELMMDALKTSIQYYVQNFGPYQFDFLRIVEIPRYFGYAISLATTVPFTESLGFIADVEECYDEGKIAKIPYPAWVTAHEVAHQWWGHQIVPAETEGAAMLTESLAQYSSLKVLEKMYGKAMIAKFLKNEQQTYQYGRTQGNYDEPALEVVGGQQSIYYNKGAIVFYGLSEYLGEEKFNQFLADYLQNKRFTSKPYPTTKYFVNSLKEVMPDSLQYTVNEWLQKVSLYDFELSNTTYQRNEDLSYTVKVKIAAKKYQQDLNNEESEIPMNEYFPIEIRNTKDEVLFSELVQLKDGEQNIEFTIKRKPKMISIDPNNIIVHKRANSLNKFSSEIEKQS